ncbi:MAG: hypothetical protein H6737_14135 [Alphaproteobacteria bacterium]|nr:hypothetical protein [Alphaproteobacteria bacterium]
MSLARSAALAAMTLAFGALVACVYQIQLISTWVPTPTPSGTTSALDFEVSDSGQHAVRRFHGTPYSYLQCFDAAGNQVGLASMKWPYVYRGVTYGPNFWTHEEEMWAIVTHEGNGQWNPAYAWLQRLDSTCHHEEFVSIPAGGVSLGAMTDLTVRTTNQSVFVASTTSPGVVHLRRYEQYSDSWSPPNLLFDGGFPVSPSVSNRLHYDAFYDEIVFGAEEQLVIHPDYFVDIGYRILDVPGGEPLRDWRVLGGWTIGFVLQDPWEGHLVLFEDDGSVNLDHTVGTVAPSPIDLGEPDPNTGIAPLWVDIPNGPVREYRLQLLSL